MRVWFKSIASMLGLEEVHERTVREVIDAAVERSAVVGLSSDASDVYPDPNCCVLDAIDGGELVLWRVGEGSRPDIVPGARFHVAIASSRGFHRGETTILSRWIEQDERGARTRAGYRASIPLTLVHMQRRGTHRVPVAFDLAPKAKLFHGESEEPRCVVPILDLSEGGIRLRVPDDFQFEVGQELLVDAEFPSALPSFRSRAEVVRLGNSKTPGSKTLALRLFEPPTDLSRAIRALELRRGGRPAA